MKKHLLSLVLFFCGGLSLIFAQAPLFFSECAEGSSNNKYIEIYNPTDSTVSLDAYAFANVSNAPATEGVYEYWNTFTEGASIASGDVYVIAHVSSDYLILAHADQTYNYLSNGDDGFALVQGTEDSYTILDFIGNFNGDPGAGWEVAGVSDATKDHTLVRKFSVTSGNTDWSASAGTNAEDSEWLVFEKDEWMYLGSHTDLVIVLGCTDMSANNYNAEATVNDGSCTFDVLGCTDSSATNYNPEANIDDNSCVYTIMGCTDSTATNYNTDAVTDDGSCEYPVDFSAVSPLFFSEFAEGSSNNKYLEIYNPTDSIVNLSNYAFPSVSNAPDSLGEYEYWNTFTEGSSIAPGDVYVIAHGSSDSLILAHADQTHNFLSNGDDGYALAFGTEADYQILDFLGDFNGDPGSGWDVAGVIEATKDHTLLRKFSVTSGNTDWTVSAGTNSEDSEWIVLENDDWTYLGSHTELSFVLGCMDMTANNYNAEATVDDGSCEYEVMEVSISQIQGMGDVSPYVDQFVSTSGIVTAVAYEGYFLQETSAAWSGVYVYDSVNVPVIGNMVSFQAKVVESYDMTELKNVSNFMVSMNAIETITPLMNISAPLTESLEGCLITLDGMCTAVANNYGEATFVSFDGESFITNDLIYGHDYSENDSYEITGVVEYNFNEYKVCPRNEADVSMLISVEEISGLNTRIYLSEASLYISSEIEGVQSFEVYAINGQRVLYGQFDGQLKLPVSMLNDAVYLVKVANHVQKVSKY